MYANQDDLFATTASVASTTTASSNYLSPVSPNSKKNNKSSGSGPRRPSSRQNMNMNMGLGSRKSSSLLRPPSSLSLAHSLGGESASTIDDDDDDELRGSGGGGGGGGGEGGLNGNGIGGGGGVGGSRQHSLAHELAFALMPEPSAGSKLLAEEFGIEYDEGAEGIDEPDGNVNGNVGGNRKEEEETDERYVDEELLDEAQMHTLSNGVQDHMDGLDNDEVMNNGGGNNNNNNGGMGISFADELGGIGEEEFREEELGVGFGSPSPDKRKKQQQYQNPVVIKVHRPEIDPMEVLAQDLESTERFLKHLKTLDSEAGMSTSTSTSSSSRALAMSRLPTNQPVLERYASDIIRRMDEAARNREGQLRELLECDRELKKIAGEVNGTEILSLVDELPSMNDDDHDTDQEFSSSTTLVTPTTHSSGRTLETLSEEDDHIHEHNHQNEWDLEDPHALNHDDSLGEEVSPSASPTKMTFSVFQPPPPMPPPSKVTPANTIPHLTHLRTFTSSLITSLTTLSEQAQVNGAATTEAGRKIKALKNKMGGWQVEWESAEKSRVRIERWEAGILEWQTDGDEGMLGSVSPARLAARRRVDGRKLVEEHLAASEKAISEATERTRAIMAR